MGRNRRRPRAHRTRANDDAADPFPPIRNLGDAFATAMGVHDRFGRAHAAFLLDGSGAVEQGFALTAPHHTVVDAVSLTLAIPDENCAGRQVVVISARGGDDVTVLAEADLAQWRDLIALIASRGSTLRDWIVCGGDNLRSIACATDPDNAWGRREV